MRGITRFFGFLFATGAILFVLGAAVVGGVFWKYSQDLPDYTQLKNYEPPVMTRVHAGDGSLLAEYARERRLFMPAAAMPALLKQAFISAEDKNFYEHNGVDPEGVVRAVKVLFEGGRAQGASTITQQVAKNFLLGNERSFERKAREAILSFRIESAYSKEKILELYLNEIFLGLGNYGVGAAALNYFNKSVHELTIAEAAYLAALPKGPNNYHPFRYPQAAIDRRNYVIARMAENKYITAEEARKARAEPLGVSPRSVQPNEIAAGFFAEEVRRDLLDKYGEKKLYEGGLSVRATLDPQMQQWARKALVDGLVRYDEAHGYRGAVRAITLGGDWGPPLAEIPALGDVSPWKLVAVLSVDEAGVRIGVQPSREKSGAIGPERVTGVIPPEGFRWAGRAARQIMQAGDVIYAEPLAGKPGQWRLRQVPEISGAILAMDPFTGRILAMVGGFSYDQSEFNRATQAWRQPGSSFKPFVYATALDNGYTPSSVVMDGPIEIMQASGEMWKPENYGGSTNYAPHTLRYGIEHSKNLMTVRLAQDVGMPLIAAYAQRFGIYDDMLPVLSMSLGAGETTLLRMVSAYSMLANGGRRVKPTVIDRVQDRWGHTIFRHDERQCVGCDAAKWENQKEPRLVDKREQILDPLTASQITSMMEGVVQRGTATVVKEVGKRLAGKTGTTNESKDVWFVGYSPDLAVGVFMGYDRPRSLGDSATAGQYAAPIFRDFMKVALKDKPDTPFRVPPGAKLISVDAKTGLRSSGAGAFLEVFKPGTAPPDSYTVIGATSGEAGGSSSSSGGGRSAGGGSTDTGGLY